LIEKVVGQGVNAPMLFRVVVVVVVVVVLRVRVVLVVGQS